MLDCSRPARGARAVMAGTSLAELIEKNAEVSLGGVPAVSTRALDNWRSSSALPAGLTKWFYSKWHWQA